MRAGLQHRPGHLNDSKWRKYASISYGYTCNCVSVTTGLFSLSCNSQWRSVVQVNSATVESGNRYSVTELVQHQQRTAVLTTPYVTSMFLHSRFSQVRRRLSQVRPRRVRPRWAGLCLVSGQARPGQALARARLGWHFSAHAHFYPD